MYNKITSFLYVVVTCIALSSCNFSSKYVKDFSLFKEKKEYEDALQKKVSIENLVNWWDRLDDPLISRLVKKLLAQNLTLKEASERVFQAREAASISQANKAPALRDGAKNSLYSNNYIIDLGVSWQHDLFNKLRSANNAAKANALAAEYNLQGITQTLIAELVYRRISVYLNNKLLQLAQENSKNAKKIYIATKKRYELGNPEIKLGDLYMAEEYYESSKKEIYQYRRLIADEMYKLDILLAQAPGTLTKTALARRINLPNPINTVGIPMSLIDRRPDLKIAEIKIIAANANIGIATHDLFPDSFISPEIKDSSNKHNNSFALKNIKGAISDKIFLNGSLRPNIKIQELKARDLLKNYANKISIATVEVETSLKSESKNLQNYRSQKGSLKFFELTQKQSDIRYFRGVETLAKLLENKRKAYNAYKLLIAYERALWKSRLNLYLSIGGDWLGKN